MDIQVMIIDIMNGSQAVYTICSLDLALIKSFHCAHDLQPFEDNEEKTRQAGMNGHLSKPIAKELLSQILDRRLL